MDAVVSIAWQCPVHSIDTRPSSGRHPQKTGGSHRNRPEEGSVFCCLISKTLQKSPAIEKVFVFLSS